jgi:hypothetical protein
MESDAKETSILQLLAGYPQFKPTDEFVDAMLRAVESYSARAVAQACQRFSDGAVPGHDNRYVLNAMELAEQVRLFHDLDARVRVPLYSGILEMDWGRGRVDMRGLTVDEQDRIIEGHGMIGKQNAAMLSLEEKREALKQGAIEGDKAVRPRLQRMTDK